MVKQVKPDSGALLLATAGLLLLLLSTTLAEASRVRRQAQQADGSTNVRPVNRPQRPLGTQASLPVSNMNTNSNVPSMSTLNDMSATGSNRLPQGASMAVSSAGTNQFGDDQMAPSAVPVRKRRPVQMARPARKQSHRDDESGDYGEEDEDCDEYNDYGGANMFRAAFRPMRQMGDMMGSMFEHMQSLASGDFPGDADGGNYAMASARSSGDGYSKLSSLVNSNGRTRGVISETRNGRTQTRRIGDDQEEE